MITAERRAGRRALGLSVGIGAVALGVLASLQFGSIPVSVTDAWEAIVDYDPDVYEQMVVRTMRVPRTVFALVVGCGLAVAGAVMQGVTRNPMADPFLFGVSGGGALGLTIAVSIGVLYGPVQLISFAFLGALCATVLVYVIGSGGRRGGSPVRMVLAGVITATLMSTWSSFIVYTDSSARETMRHLLIGTLAGRSLDDYGITVPFILGGVVVCILMAHQLNVLALGEDAARSVGMKTSRVRFTLLLLTAVIAGACVAAVGPIGFVGLAVPHMVRYFTGEDYRWLLVFSAIFGAALLLAADVLGRVLLNPAELEASIVMGMIGAPFFIWLARRRSLSS
ncbi:iron ABC transporter permease [Microbacterium sp. NPDC089189]|uniref:FecCD family ABC transporter permease n=1 Tax=Microbacterium sp. NPDC089189 TaxID=3154972 RepID=UPI00341DDFDB